MAKRKRYSKLNPAYLGKRHAGMVFMFLALGLFAGIVWRSLIQGVRYTSETEVAVAVEPREYADTFNWDAKRHDWNGILQGRAEQGLLNANLRHAVKLAVTRYMTFSTEELSARLAFLEPQETFSASLFTNPLLAHFGKTVDVSRRDLAANLDFQSLAVIVSDLDPPRGVTGWDFTFFNSFLPDKPEKAIVASTRPDSPYFKVFYTLYALLNNGRAPVSPSSAWRAAVDEVTARLEREAKFSGGGGFGPHAKRELMRELVAIPVLAANCLYHTNGWFNGESRDLFCPTRWEKAWSSAFLSLRQNGPATGTLAMETEMTLHPLFFPRDTVLTRMPPLMVSTLVSFLAAYEEAGAETTATAWNGKQYGFVPFESCIPSVMIASASSLASLVAPERTASASTQDESAGTDDDAGPDSAAGTDENADNDKDSPVTTGDLVEMEFREVIDDIANKQRLSTIAMLEDALKMALRDHAACLRRLDAARGEENRLMIEAINARARSDRLRERYDEAVMLAEPDYEAKVPEETEKLFAARDAQFRRLLDLLTYCTEEHPFVKQAKRELESLEAVLETHQPDPAQFRRAEARATRVANLYLEWESASAGADSLEERRDRQSEAVSCLADEAEEIECTITLREGELASAKNAPVPITRIAVPVKPKIAPAVCPPEPETVEETPVRTAEPVVKPVAKPAPRGNTARLVVASAPSRIPLYRHMPGWGALFCGLLGGLLAGILWVMARELFSRYFANPAEARRMTQLPVLASLPKYEAASYKAAAGTMKGELMGRRFPAMHFVPSAVELFEPAAVGRRGKIYPAKKNRRLFGWAAGLLCLLLAGVVFYQARSGKGVAAPRVDFTGEMPLPSVTIPLWSEEREGKASWGDLP